MEINSGREVKKASPEGRSEEGGGLGSPDHAARSGEVAKEDRLPARHRTGSRKVRELHFSFLYALFLYQHNAVSGGMRFSFFFLLTSCATFPWPCAALAPRAPRH